MLSVAVGWQVYDMTSNPLDLGFIGLVIFLPGAGFSLLAGHVADRFDRRGIIMVCEMTQALGALTLALLTFHGLASPWPIYMLLFLLGPARAFQGPASQALLPRLVPPEHFSNAVAWSSSIWQLAVILGPGMGGAVYSISGGPMAVYLLTACCLLCSFCSTAAIATRTGRMEKEDISWKTVLAGVHYIFDRRAILGAISLDLFAVLLGGAVALLPAFARDILMIGPIGLGILRSAPAVGAALTALAVAHLPPMRRAGPAMLWCVAGFGTATIIFGLSTSFPLSLLCLFLLGSFDMVSVIVRHTLVQLLTPHSMQGRVAAANLVFIGASNELGEFESGVTAACFGLVPAVVLGGMGTLLVTLLWAWGFPELRQVKRLDDLQAFEEPASG